MIRKIHLTLIRQIVQQSNKIEEDFLTKIHMLNSYTAKVIRN